MSWKSSASRYGSVAIAIHWLSAAAIAALFALGFMAAATVDAAHKADLLRAHAPLGILVLVLTLARLAWWRTDRRPAPQAGQPRWQTRLHGLLRVLLYAFILLMGASGIAMFVLSGAGAVLFFGAAQPLPDFHQYAPRFGHGIGAAALLALAGLHVAAALYHQFVRRDRLLARMGLGRPI